MYVWQTLTETSLCLEKMLQGKCAQGVQDPVGSHMNTKLGTSFNLQPQQEVPILLR